MDDRITYHKSIPKMFEHDCHMCDHMGTGILVRGGVEIPVDVYTCSGVETEGATPFEIIFRSGNEPDNFYAGGLDLAQCLPHSAYAQVAKKEGLL